MPYHAPAAPLPTYLSSRDSHSLPVWDLFGLLGLVQMLTGCYFGAWIRNSANTSLKKKKYHIAFTEYSVKKTRIHKMKPQLWGIWDILQTCARFFMIVLKEYIWLGARCLKLFANVILINTVVPNCKRLWRLVTEHGTSPWCDGTNTPCSYGFLSAFLIQVWVKMILFAWNGVNSSRLVFAGRQTDYIISEGQDTFIWPCSGRLKGQNRTQFDSYYGRLAAVHFKTIIIWSGWDVQIWNFTKCQGAL